MWKQIADVGKQILALARDMQQCKADIAEVRQHDRENLLLRLENALLRFDRRLAPPENPLNTPE